MIFPSHQAQQRPNTTTKTLPSCVQARQTGTLAVTAQAPGQSWGRWSTSESIHHPQHNQPLDNLYAMDISGLMHQHSQHSQHSQNPQQSQQTQAYHSRASSRPSSNVAQPLPRTIVAPHYGPQVQTFGVSAAPQAHSLSSPLNHRQLQLHNPFPYSAYTTASPHPILPAFAGQQSNYIPQRPLQVPRLVQPESYARSNHHSQSPPIKTEQLWKAPKHTSSPLISTHVKSITTPTPTNGSQEVVFGTEVDTLMKAIQAKATSKPSSPAMNAQTQPAAHFVTPALSRGQSDRKRSVSTENEGGPKGIKKRYQCTIEGCSKSFFQKTHLDIHERAHTGVKPYPCTAIGCGRSFSQLGNLKTHQRRHTGERPYPCDICGKRFAQRGNVRAHKIVHDSSKPYYCRLDDCGKQFTQLGNLKSHQNKFHIAAIRSLTAKFSTIKDGDLVTPAERELWDYFANLYKNSNKGIKGRGKDRKAGSAQHESQTSHHGYNSARGSYSANYTGSRRAAYPHGYASVNAAGGQMGGPVTATHTRSPNGDYEMFDVDEHSMSGRSNSLSHSQAGSVSTMYDDTTEHFSDASMNNRSLTEPRGNHLAFGDRMY